MSLSVMLDKRVSLQQRATGQDAAGGPAAGWTEVAPAWASIVDLSGGQYLAAGGAQNKTTTKIVIRYRADIMAKMRVVHGVEIYDIEAVLNQNRRTLLLMCSKGVNSG